MNQCHVLLSELVTACLPKQWTLKHVMWLGPWSLYGCAQLHAGGILRSIQPKQNYAKHHQEKDCVAHLLDQAKASPPLESFGKPSFGILQEAMLWNLSGIHPLESFWKPPFGIFQETILTYTSGSHPSGSHSLKSFMKPSFGIFREAIHKNPSGNHSLESFREPSFGIFQEAILKNSLGSHPSGSHSLEYFGKPFFNIL